MSEKQLYNKFVDVLKIDKNIGHVVDKTDLKPIKDRLEIISGEIESQNNSPLLIKEADELLKKLVKGGAISAKVSKEHLKQLKDFNKP